MNRYWDTARFMLISPELLCALLPLVAYTYSPSIVDALIKQMNNHSGLSFGIGASPLVMLAFNYKEGLDILAPTGARKVLIEWPDYSCLKARVFASFGWCVLGTLFSFITIVLLANDPTSRLAVTILAAGVLASAAATATIGLAKFASREIIGE